MKNFFFLICSTCLIFCGCREESQEPPTFSVEWILSDSLVLKSSLTDTIMDGWPYFLDGNFYLLSFFKAKAYGFDQKGQMINTMGKGYGQGPEEFLDVSALTSIDSLMGIYQSTGNKISFFTASGRLHHELNLGTEINKETFYTNIDTRRFNFYKNRFYNPVDPGNINHHFFEYYDLPIFSIHDQEGHLINVHGKRALIYNEKMLPYARTVYVEIDSFNEQILISQHASHRWEKYLLDGAFVGQYGIPGKYISDQDWPDVGFTGLPQTKENKRREIEMIFNTPQYTYMIALTSDYYIRSYRRGIEIEEGIFNFLDKPHYLQIYNQEGHLLSDGPAPDLYFMPVAVQEGELWVNLKRSYNTGDFSYTLYRYRLLITSR